MKNTLTILLLALVLALGGCAHNGQDVSAPSLDGIAGKVDSAKKKIQTAQAALASASGDLDLNGEIKTKQAQIDSVTGERNEMRKELTYLQAKYAEAVKLLWKWRVISLFGSLGSLITGALAGAILMAIFRLWLKANVPILGGLIP